MRLFSRGGAIGVVELTETGEQDFVELTRVRTMRQTDKQGHYRFYNEYRLPNGDTVTLRLDTTEQDKERKLNRSENVRAIAPSDPNFAPLYKRRSDIESINRSLEDTLWLGRAHSRGATRQLVNLIGFALMTNSLAVYLHRNRRNAEGSEGNLASAA